MRLLLALVAVLACTAPAQAGTMKHQQSRADFWVEFTAAPGERNDITVEYLEQGIRVTDAAGRPTGDCTPDGPTSVVCFDPILIVRAGDGDDRVVSRGAVYGGPGADDLVGSRVVGGPGRDRITGTEHDDNFYVGDGEADVVDGRGGTDRVSYGGAGGIRVDLTRGRASDGDQLAGVENVYGSAGDDVLIGDDGPNALNAAGGSDRVRGRGGADRIDALRGRDRIDAGAGRDRINVGGTPVVRCGADADRITYFGGEPRVRADCERLEGEGPLLRQRAGVVTARWRIGRHERPCRFTVTVDGARVRPGRPLRPSRPARLRFTVRGRCESRHDPWDISGGNGYSPARVRLL